MKRLVLPFVCLLGLVACHSANAPSVRQPDGSWHLECGSSLDTCVGRANDLCGNRGFVVLGGVSRRKLYGAELGQSQVEVREAELDVACADRRGELPKVLNHNSALALPPRPAESAPPAEPVATPAPPAKPLTACTPGSTQRCIGAGACTGGQACLADGSGYAPCDCGSSGHAAAPTP